MSLRDELEQQGNWLFQRRSYVPVAFITLFLLALHGYRWPFERYADYQLWARCCLALSFTGLIVRCATIGFTPIGTSGRNTDRQRAWLLNTTGMYSVVRHPLYLGNFIIGLGVSLAPFVWWLPVIYSLLFCTYYERIIFAEEAFLLRRFGREFREWAADTPTFFPARLHWRSPALPFSLRNVLRREYTGFLVVVLSNAAVQFCEHLVIDRGVVYEAFWVTLLLLGSFTYFLLKHLKKKTTVLDVIGR